MLITFSSAALALSVGTTSLVVSAAVDTALDFVFFDRRHNVRTSGWTSASSGAGARSELGRRCGIYMPSSVRTVRSILAALPIDSSDYTFVDLGSGKGRVLLVASEFAFRRIVGIERSPVVNAAALANIRTFESAEQKCFAIDSLCMDAASFAPPAGPLVVFMFNPFGRAIIEKVVANLARSYQAAPRPIYIVFHHPRWTSIITRTPPFRRAALPGANTDYFDVFRTA